MNRLNSLDETYRDYTTSPYWWPDYILEVKGQDIKVHLLVQLLFIYLLFIWGY